MPARERAKRVTTSHNPRCPAMLDSQVAPYWAQMEGPSAAAAVAVQQGYNTNRTVREPGSLQAIPKQVKPKQCVLRLGLRSQYTLLITDAATKEPTTCKFNLCRNVGGLCWLTFGVNTLYQGNGNSQTARTTAPIRCSVLIAHFMRTMQLSSRCFQHGGLIHLLQPVAWSHSCLHLVQLTLALPERPWGASFAGKVKLAGKHTRCLMQNVALAVHTIKHASNRTP